MSNLERAREILKDLVAFPSVSSHSNLDIIQYMADYLRDFGARVDVLLDADGGKANLFASLGPEGDGGIVLSGHSDVVPVEDQDWTASPWELTERFDNLFGRGTCDMKGFIACALAMAQDYAVMDLKRPVHFAFTHDEEVGCIGAKALADFLKMQDFSPKVAIIGEPTMMRCIEGHKGVCEYSCEFRGREGHGSLPDLGVNAVEYAVRYVTRLMEIREDLKARAPAGSQFEPPWTTINIGAIHGGVAHNVIAGKALVEWEFRPVQNADYDFVHHEIGEYVDNELLPAMRAVDEGASITTMTVGEVIGLEPMKDNEAKDIVMALTGDNRAELVSFGTEAGIFQGLDMSAVVCGPGSIEQAHKADEYVSVEQLQACLDMLEKLGKEVLS